LLNRVANCETLINYSANGVNSNVSETGALKKERISTGNHFEEEDFYPDEL
jgi:hypothetical protein